MRSFLFLLFLFYVLPAFAHLQCVDYLQVNRQEALDFYGQLKEQNPSSLNIRTSYERNLLLKGIQQQAGQRPILIFSDASFVQSSGVVTVMNIFKQIQSLYGINLQLVVPEDFKKRLSVKYQDLVLAFPSGKEILDIVNEQNPFAIHIMIEGTVGRKVRQVLLKEEIPFTTAYHTDFPKYVSSTIKTPFLRKVLEGFTYKLLRSFHKPSKGILVPTRTMKEELVRHGFGQDYALRDWSHGVDTKKFHPRFRDQTLFKNYKSPISLFVGRVAPEKNLEAFLSMKIPGTKLIIGDGPDLNRLQSKYPEAVFLGRKSHDELPKYFASSDIFVFPSLTDTFGLVLLEAAASGTPVLAFNVQGPKDAINSTKAGALVKYHNNFEASVNSLEQGFKTAIDLERDGVRQYAESHSWEKSLLEFLYFLDPI